MPALGINLGYLIVQIINFIIVFLVLYAWVYNPLQRMLEKRRQTVAQGLEDARVAAEARSNAERDAERIISESQVKAAEIVREATERAGTVERELRTQAEADIVRLRQTAATEVEQERTQMLGGLRSQVVTLAIAAAQRLIGESLMADDSRQRALLQEFFAGVRDGRVVVLENAEPLSGASAEVTSALPLTPEEQETIKREVLSSAGAGTVVSFRVDPSILGGLVVRAGDRVIDASVSGQLQDLRQNLQ